MANHSPAPFFTGTPDISIPIPYTSQELPLMWEHTRAIRRLSRFFAGLYTRTQQSQEQGGLDKCKSWMVTLCQMTASIYDEVVRRDSPDEMAAFLTADDPVNESVEALEAANNLITPIMNYIRDAKGTLSLMGCADRSEKTKAEAAAAASAASTSPTVKEEEPGS